MGACAIQARSGMECPAASPPPNLIPAHLQPIFSKHSLEHRITSWFWAGGVLNSYKNILLIPAHLQPIFSKHSLEHKITSWFCILVLSVFSFVKGGKEHAVFEMRIGTRSYRFSTSKVISKKYWSSLPSFSSVSICS